MLGISLKEETLKKGMDFSFYTRLRNFSVTVLKNKNKTFVESILRFLCRTLPHKSKGELPQFIKIK